MSPGTTALDLSVVAIIDLQGDEGCSFSYIYANNPNIPDQISLTGSINRLTRKGLIHKVGDLYFERKHSPKEKPCEAPKTTPTKVITTQTKRTVLKPQVEEVLQGQLRRGAISGKVVYLIYQLKSLLPERGISNREIEAILRTTASASLYQILVKLVREGYIKLLSGTASNGVFQWSGRFSYPFPTFDPSDKFLIDHKAIMNTLVPKEPSDLLEAEHPVIEFLKQEIQYHELAILRCKEKIESLRT